MHYWKSMWIYVTNVNQKCQLCLTGITSDTVTFTVLFETLFS